MFSPGPIATLSVAVALFAGALLIAVRGELLAAPGLAKLAGIGSWLLAAAFGARAVGDFRYVGFFKRVKCTRFACLDTVLYSPLCAAIAILAVDVAHG